MAATGTDSINRQSAGAAASGRAVKVYCDGGCRPNPGPIEVAVVLRGRVMVRADMGHGSHRDAEWLALIAAVQQASAQGLRQIVVLADAREVVQQASAALAAGTAAAMPAAAQRHAENLLAAAAAIHVLRLRWVKRQQNLAGIALAARHPR